jgi:hypothetical protein
MGYAHVTVTGHKLEEKCNLLSDYGWEVVSVCWQRSGFGDTIDLLVRSKAHRKMSFSLREELYKEVTPYEGRT